VGLTTLVGGEVLALLPGYDVIPRARRLQTVIALLANGRDADVLQPGFYHLILYSHKAINYIGKKKKKKKQKRRLTKTHQNG